VTEVLLASEDSASGVVAPAPATSSRVRGRTGQVPAPGEGELGFEQTVVNDIKPFSSASTRPRQNKQKCS